MQVEYMLLLRQIRQLANELLPAVNPTASYTSGETLRTLAFRLSAHAEIEGFLEACAESLTNTFAQKNKGRTLSARIQRALLLHKGLVQHYPPRSLMFSIPADAARQIDGVLNTHFSTIEQNNGVSEKDVIKLFVPLGVELAFFSEQWLRSLNDLARSRGEAAHHSWLSTGLSQPDPVEERRRLVVPLWGLKPLIDEVERIRRLA